MEEKGEIEIRANKLNSQLTDLSGKFEDLFEDYRKLLNENSDLQNEITHKKLSENEVFKLTDKYEEEIFNLKCGLNIWKNAFIEIAKYKLLNYDDSNSDELVELDKNYLQNSPIHLREKADSILTYFRSLIEEETYQTSNLKALKEALLIEQEKTYSLKELLNNELNLRRKIQNRYMLIRGNLRVMCRIRPFLENENSSLVKKAFLDTFEITNDSITLLETNVSNRKKKYDMDYIFGQRSLQHEVYEEVSLLVQSMIRGNNICVISYGQTCSGKTYTIQGHQNLNNKDGNNNNNNNCNSNSNRNNNYNNPGISVRVAKELFELLNLYDRNKPKNLCSKLSLSIIEIYNENIYNLLNEDIPLLNIYENSSNNLIIPDLNPINIENFNEAGKLFKLASKLRKTKETNYNDRSSRSHCIYTFHLKFFEGEKTIRSKMHIIDLAGSERISKNIGVMDEILKKEAISINQSLTSLANVLNSIAVKSSHIPYRDSKLTHFLKESINENYNIILLLHISPNIKDIAETFSTLEFGNRIVKICKHKTGKEKNK
jgi:kinesin family protein C2/C3